MNSLDYSLGLANIHLSFIFIYHILKKEKYQHKIMF